MSSKILKHIKKVIVMLAIITICTPHAAYAFSIGSGSNKSTNYIQSLLSRFFNTEKPDKYISIREALQKFKEMLSSGNAQLSDIYSIIEKLEPGVIKTQLASVTDSFARSSANGSSGLNIGSLLNVLIGLLSSLVDGLVGLIGGNELKGVTAENISITATTAEKFASGYGVKLHGNIYRNKNATENKWALVIHPFMMSGKTMANAVGTYYYNKGYNILAIDLRGFGDSKGSVALGFLESLDAYDWLVEMNQNTETFGKIDHIIVHGTSLGGATTNFLSGINGFMANGPKKMELQSLKDLNVRGLVEDCGYKNMEQFADKSFIMSLGVGLSTDEEFAYYGNALHSLQYCELPLLTIHGDADTMVKYNENAPYICNQVNSNNYGGSAKLVTISGGAHALIIMGNNGTYETAVNDFIKGINEDDNFAFERVNYDISKSGGLLDSLLGMLKGLFK